MSSSSSMSSYDGISDSSMSYVEGNFDVVGGFETLSVRSASRASSVAVPIDEEPTKKEDEIIEKLDSVSKTTDNIEKKLEMMSAMMAAMAEEIKELKKEKAEKVKEEPKEEPEKEKPKRVAKLQIPITQTINGEWKQVKSTNLDEYIACLNFNDQHELKWRAGNLCFKVMDTDLYSTHRVVGIPDVQSTKTELLPGYQEAPDLLYQTYIEDNKVVTTHRSKTDGTPILRIERSVENGLLTAVYETGTVTCTRVYRRVGNF